MYSRSHLETLKARLSEPLVRSIQILAGPRQVGKTTLIRDLLRRLEGQNEVRNDAWMFEAVDQFDSARRIDLSATEVAIEDRTTPRNADWLAGRWNEARFNVRQRLSKQKTNGTPYLLVFDEIQKIPNWSEQVKGLWDADRAERLPMHVVLLGSSPLLVQKGLTESLAGRYELINVRHWALDEMQDAFDVTLDEYIFFGGYPGAISLRGDEPRWRNYVLASLIAPSIERDVLSLHRVEKPALLRSLFELSAAYSGQILSYTKMTGQLQDAGNTTTLAHYLSLLEQSGLVSGLHKYAGEVVRRRASSPKLNVHNTALMTAPSGYTFQQAKADREFWGRLTEACIGAHLINTAEHDCDVYHWRESPHEVDFILRRGRNLTAIEVKSGTKTGHVSGLTSFADSFPVTRKLIVGNAAGCDASIAEFLSQPAAFWTNPAHRT
ncbi:MAG: ATP-binding protein [Betaproteobacteria bacterium]|nr:MAG: ATP-binding protein [Betaproteobacteria bacterium]